MRYPYKAIGGLLFAAALGVSSFAEQSPGPSSLDNPDNQSAKSSTRIMITGEESEKVALLVVDNDGKLRSEPLRLRIGPKGTLELRITSKDYEGLNTGSHYMYLSCNWVADPSFFNGRIEIKKSWDHKAGSAYGSGGKDKLFDGQAKEWKPGNGNELKIAHISWSEDENDIAHAKPVGSVILKRGDIAWDDKK